MSSMIVLSPAREVMTETLAVEIASPSGTKRVARDLPSPAGLRRPWSVIPPMPGLGGRG